MASSKGEKSGEAIVESADSIEPRSCIRARRAGRSLCLACCLTCFRLHPPRLRAVATEETCRRACLFPVPRKLLAALFKSSWHSPVLVELRETAANRIC